MDIDGQNEDDDIQAAIQASLQDGDRNPQIGPPRTAININEAVANISTIFNGIDEDFVRQRLGQIANNPNAIDQLVGELIEMQGQYPRTLRVAALPKNDPPKKGPPKDYTKTDSKVSDDYIRLSCAYVTNEYPQIPLSELIGLLEARNYHLTPTLAYIKDNLKVEGNRASIGGKTFSLSPLKRNNQQLGVINDKDFQEELDIYEAPRRREIARQQYIDNGGILIPCPICYDDLEIDQYVDCTNNHVICKSCVAASVSAGLEQQQINITCIGEADCSGYYRESVLQQCLGDDDMYRLDGLRAIEALRGIEGLSECPFCDYKEIIENENQQIFLCQNPRCGKKSCRKCKKVAIDQGHQCEEQQDEGQQQLRLYVEEKMTEARIRRCSSCNRPLVKTQGCNKITCICGKFLCYGCGSILDMRDPYSHWNNPTLNTKGCVLHEDSTKKDEERVKQARIKAEADWKRDHPQYKDAKLKIDYDKIKETDHDDPFIRHPFMHPRNPFMPQIPFVQPGVQIFPHIQPPHIHHPHFPRNPQPNPPFIPFPPINQPDFPEIPINDPWIGFFNPINDPPNIFGNQPNAFNPFGNQPNAPNPFGYAPNAPIPRPFIHPPIIRGPNVPPRPIVVQPAIAKVHQPQPQPQNQQQPEQQMQPLIQQQQQQQQYQPQPIIHRNPNLKPGTVDSSGKIRLIRPARASIAPADLHNAQQNAQLQMQKSQNLMNQNMQRMQQNFFANQMIQGNQQMEQIQDQYDQQVLPKPFQIPPPQPKK